MAETLPLEEFSNKPGHPLIRAALQQIALITALYDNRRDQAEELLGTPAEASIIKWKHNPGSFDPSYCVIRQGRDTFLVMAGTVNGFQWGIHFLGSPGADYDLDEGVTAHAAHQLFARKMRDQDLAGVVTAPAANERLFLAGHSYGGSICQWLANHYVGACQDPERVQLMTFGAPKLLTAGYKGPAPAVYQRICHATDLVPWLPPGSVSLMRPRRAIERLVKMKGFQWYQYGQRWELFPGDRMEAVGSLENYLPSFPLPSEGFYQADHIAETYSRNLRQQFGDPRALSPRTANLVRIAADIEGAPIPPEQLPPPPPEAYTTPAEQNAKWFRGVPVLGSPSDVSTLRASASWAAGLSVSTRNIGGSSAGMVLMPSGIWKISLMVNNGKYGRSVSFHKSTGSMPLVEVVDEAKSIAQVWAGLLGNAANQSGSSAKGLGSPMIEFIRITDAIDTRYGTVVINQDGDSKYFGPQRSKEADFLGVALSLRMPGETTAGAGATSYAALAVSGQPDDVIKAGAYRGDQIQVTGFNGFTGTWDALLKKTLEELIKRGYGFVGRTPAEPDKVVSQFEFSAEGALVCTITAHGYDHNDVVVLKSANEPGFNGTYRIKRIDANSFLLLGKLYPNDLLRPTYGKVYRVRHANGQRIAAFYKYVVPHGGFQTPMQVQVRKRNPGRQFFPASFSPRRARRKAK